MPLPATADCWFLSGPTASGKTRVSIALAERLGAEILSLDSMALFRGLDIGTAKPTVAERASAVHHLLDLVPPEAEFSLASYVEAAERTSGEIQKRGKVPLFVGGTPLYLKALLRGIFEGPAADWELRQRLEAEIAEHGAAALHARLATVDPEAALRLHPNDARRMIRAWEVFEKTGQPISRLQQQFDLARPASACRVFVLEWPREALNRRIDERVDAMFASGLVDEVRSLMAEGTTLSRTARQALGYREVLAYLAGERNLAETIDLVKVRTRQLAKRQLTWFRSLSECTPIAMDHSLTSGEIADRIFEMGQHRR